MKTNTKVFAYIRVSTTEQNTDRQIDCLRKYISSDRDMFIDKASGKNFDRPKYLALKSTLRKGDTVYIKSLDRLGRNKQAIKEELEYFKQEGIIIRCLDIPTTLMDFGNFGDFQQSIMEMINNILIEVIGTIAEQERKTIHLRQAEGIQAAKSRGKHFGRPRTELPANFVQAYTDWKSEKSTAVKAMELTGLSKATFYRLVKAYENSNK